MRGWMSHRTQAILHLFCKLRQENSTFNVYMDKIYGQWLTQIKQLPLYVSQTPLTIILI